MAACGLLLSAPANELYLFLITTGEIGKPSHGLPHVGAYLPQHLVLQPMQPASWRASTTELWHKCTRKASAKTVVELESNLQASKKCSTRDLSFCGNNPSAKASAHTFTSDGPGLFLYLDILQHKLLKKLSSNEPCMILLTGLSVACSPTRAYD